MFAIPLLEPPPGGSTAFCLDDDDNLLEPRQLVDLLDQHKALILQSSDTERPWTTDDFGDLVSNMELEYYPYIGGAAPRTIIPVRAGGDIVFTANERYVPIYIYIYIFYTPSGSIASSALWTIIANTKCLPFALSHTYLPYRSTIYQQVPPINRFLSTTN
jgi:hypothetical protein